MKLKTNSGQALLIVLLSMAVVLTIVLSVLARSVTDVSISSQDEDSLRAFSAAEAGIENALIIGSNIESTLIGDANYSVNVSSFAEGEKEFNYPSSLFSGESATVWFVAHDENEETTCTVEKPCFTGESFHLCWGKEGTESDSSFTPAIEVIVFYTSTPGIYSTTKIARVAIDPNVSRRTENNFDGNEVDNCTVSGNTYPFYKIINFRDLGILNSSTQNVLQFAIVRFLYNTNISSPFGVSVDESLVLPSQGTWIESSGSSGDANRRIEVYKSFNKIPEVFEFGVYSYGSLVK